MKAFFDCGHYKGSLTPEGLRTRYKVTKEQSPGIRKFELRWMKLVELDEFGEGGDRSNFSSHDSVS